MAPYPTSKHRSLWSQVSPLSSTCWKRAALSLLTAIRTLLLRRKANRILRLPEEVKGLRQGRCISGEALWLSTIRVCHFYKNTRFQSPLLWRSPKATRRGEERIKVRGKITLILTFPAQGGRWWAPVFSSSVVPRSHRGMKDCEGRSPEAISR